MNYRVDWLYSTIKELATLWTNADSATRNRITKATHEIDSQLTHDPLNVGESRAHGRRMLIEAPLGVNYRVDNGDVTVLHVWRFRERIHP